MADGLSRSHTLTPPQEHGSTAVIVAVDPARQVAVQMLIGS
jgi:hypothetical protein